MKHTPGPWLMWNTDRESWISLPGFADIVLYIEDNVEREEWKANARLIAAAPGLLAACEAIKKKEDAIVCAMQFVDADIYAELELVDAAIAKATGTGEVPEVDE